MRKTLRYLPLVAASVFVSPPALGLDNEPAARVVSDALQIRIGSFRPRETTPSPKGSSLALGLAAERRYGSGLRLGFDADFIVGRYNTPPISGGPFTVVDDSMNLDFVSIGGFAAQGWVAGAADFYVGGGLGVYFSRMTASASTLGLPGYHEERDTGLGFTLLAGVDFRIEFATRLGIEVRRLSLDASFGPLSNGSMSIGGTAIMFSWRRAFSGTFTP